MRSIRRPSVFFLILFLIVPSSFFSAENKVVILATTTSTQDSGLLDLLIPVFEKKTGYFVKTIAVGTGQALTMGRRGEADVLLVHAPSSEKSFMKEGYGIRRRLVMHNDFIVVGPPSDPAKIKGLKKASLAFKRIAEARALFLSRGDGSGTHLRELEIWKAAGVDPKKALWYQEAGLGMGQTLGVASEKRAYTLSDRGTYLALKKNLELQIFIEGDPVLLNLYHVIEVNPSRWKRINAKGAKAFADFLLSREAQEIIENFGVDKFGSPLFFPDGGKREEDLLH